MINPTIKYPRPTTIRSKRIGHYLGTVVSVLNEPFAVWFQLYHLGDSLDLPGFMVREDRYDNELDAVAMFEAWEKEAELLVAAGDM